tara:strand:- start:217 stop:456 length:240 start_codon:yes stop_codon:yes gene_type:complete
MKTYKIEARKETHYLLEIEAKDEKTAKEKAALIIAENMSPYDGMYVIITDCEEQEKLVGWTDEEIEMHAESHRIGTLDC